MKTFIKIWLALILLVLAVQVGFNIYADKRLKQADQRVEQVIAEADKYKLDLNEKFKAEVMRMQAIVDGITREAEIGGG